MNFNVETAEFGIQSTSVPMYWDEDNNHRYTRIDDVELAHDMALAEDPLMERAIEQRQFIESLSEDPEATYRRAGRKAILFSELIEEQKRVDDESSESTYPYEEAAPTLEEYTRRKVGKYEGDRWLPKSSVHITNGFVTSLAEEALKRTMQAADKAGTMAYYKQKQRENITVYEQQLSRRDQNVFRPADPEPTRHDVRLEDWLEGDEEAIALRRRSHQLWQTYKRKRVVEAIAETFGRTSTRGLTRDDFERLSEVVKKNHYIIED